MPLEQKGPPTLDVFRSIVGREIDILKDKLQGGKPANPEHFNYRGELYGLALKIAPDARHADHERMWEWLDPQENEIGADVASGTGFLTRPLSEITKARLYGFDTSRTQINTLVKRIGVLPFVPKPIIPIRASFTDQEALAKMYQGDLGNLDFVTSFAGIHHMIEPGQQESLFRNVARALRPGGRFVAADVGEGTALAEHFETSVRNHCLTGHLERWLSPERIRGELTEGTGLTVVKAEILENHEMVFNSEEQMALWAKSLHAYDLPEEDIKKDLKKVLTYRKEDGKLLLNWPLLFFHLEKTGN